MTAGYDLRDKSVEVNLVSKELCELKVMCGSFAHAFIEMKGESVILLLLNSIEQFVFSDIVDVCQTRSIFHVRVNYQLSRKFDLNLKSFHLAQCVNWIGLFEVIEQLLQEGFWKKSICLLRTILYYIQVRPKNVFFDPLNLAVK